MSSVGIITFSDSINYGAVLQMTALSSVVRDLGHSVEVIDYRRGREEPPAFGRLARLRRAANARVSKSLGLGARVEATIEFRRDAIPMSPSTYVGGDLMRHPPDYDAYITGSDQVWNLEHTGRDTSFLLDFVPEGRKKISYAASFGHGSVGRRDAEVLAEFLPDFDAISVREDTGVDIVRSATGEHAQLVLDPTLLLGAEEWRKYASPSMQSGPYILEYVMPGHRDTEKAVRKTSQAMADRVGGKVVVVGARPHTSIGARSLHDIAAGPREFLGYIDGSAGVVTNSFHGTALAILFAKPMVSVYRRPGEHATARSGRQISLLSSLGLAHRGVETEAVGHRPWELLEARGVMLPTQPQGLTQQREASVDFLRRALEP